MADQTVEREPNAWAMQREFQVLPSPTATVENEPAELGEAQVALLRELGPADDPKRIVEVLSDGRTAVDRNLLLFLAHAATNCFVRKEVARGLHLATIGAAASTIASDDYYAARFQMLTGTGFGLVGENELARELLSSAIRKVLPLVEGGSAPAADVLGQAVANYASAVEGDEHRRRARTQLAEALVATRAGGAFGVAALVCGELIVVCLQMNDLDAAIRYAETGSALYGAASAGPEELWPRMFADRLMALASNLIIDNERREEGMEWASRASSLDPENLFARRLLARTLMHVGDLHSARREWDAVLALDPSNDSAKLNLAQILNGLGQHEDALERLDDVASLDVDYWAVRGFILQTAERYQDAADSFARALELFAQGERARGDPFGIDPPGRLEVGVRLAMIEVHKRLRSQDIMTHVAALDALADHPDFGLFVLISQGKAWIELDQTKRALSSFGRAVEIDPSSAWPRVARADVLVDLGRTDEALEDLVEAARMQPDLVVPRAQRILEQNPESVGARQCLGLALTHLGQAERALTEFDRAIEESEDNARLYLQRGLTRLTLDLGCGVDEGWNATVGSRIPDALADFATAARIDDANEEARAAFRWLVQRIPNIFGLMASPVLAAMVKPVLPEGVRGLSLAAEAYASMSYADWPTAGPALEKAQSALRDAGLDVLADALEISLADVHSQLYDIPAALDHVAAARAGLATVVAPLTSDLAAYSAEAQGEATARSRPPEAHFELEYISVYRYAIAEWLSLIAIIEAEALSRAGDQSGAANTLGDVGELCKTISGIFPPPMAVQSLVKAAKVLRDAKRYEEATHAADAALALAGTEEERARALMVKGAIHVLTGEAALAIPVFEECAAIAQRGGFADAEALDVVARMNVVSTMIHNGQAEEALRRLEEWTGTFHRRHDQRNFLLVRAQARASTGDLEGSLSDVVEAIDSLENERMSFRTPQLNIAWRGRQEDVYSYGVQVAVAAGQPTIALELAEKARSRALLDQLTPPRAASPGDAPLGATEASLAERVSLLRTLAYDLRARGPAWLDFGIVDRLADMGQDVGFVDTSPGRPPRIVTERLERALHWAERSLEDARADLANRRFTQAAERRPMRYEEIVRVLGESPGAEDLGPRAGADSSILAEFFVLEEQTLLFVATSTSDEPEVFSIPLSRADIRDFAARAFDDGGVWTADDAEWDAFSGSLLAPLLELAPEGRHICLVPHDGLHYIPIHAGRWDDGHFIDRHPISYSPSATLIELCRSRR